MPYIKVEDFSGIVPRTGPTQIEANQAQTALNVKLQSRELRSWADPVLEYVPTTPNVQTIYRIDSPSGQKYWLEWATDVDMVPGPVADINEFRYYYTGDGAPKKTNYALATTNGTGTRPFPDAWLYMGVPAPTGAATLAASSGAAPNETRAYVYTYVSTFGTVKEESAPSPAATVVVSTSGGATVTVSGFTAAPTTGYNITHRRIYRTITGATNVVYSFVAEIPIATTSYVDSLSVTQLGSELPSLYWTPPPAGLKGLVAMPNGILAAFEGNQIYFSEPYYPHAWPDIYALTVDYPIVGLGVYETTLVVLTTKFPYLISGVSPASMTQQKLPIPQPCVSKKSIASDQYGVLYASPNGLVSLGSGSQDVVTVPLYTRDEWQALQPETMVGMIYNNMYMGFYSPDGILRTGLVLSRGDIPPLINLDFPARSVFVDRSTSDIFAVDNANNTVYQLDASPINFTTFEWLSKKFVMPNPTNFGAIKVQADFGFMDDLDAYNAYVAYVEAINAALFVGNAGNVEGQMNTGLINQFSFNGSLLLDIPTLGTTRYITVIIYADGQQIWEGDILNQEPLRLPALQKGYVYEIRISGNTPTRMVAVASSIGELRQIAP
jgi:hypothetical protein